MYECKRVDNRFALNPQCPIRLYWCWDAKKKDDAFPCIQSQCMSWIEISNPTKCHLLNIGIEKDEQNISMRASLI